jgi:hypothetical protein
MTPINLANLTPFANGGNRLCFIHPDDSRLCIKVARPGFSPAEKRSRKKFPKTLKPLRSFDDSQIEHDVLTKIQNTLGDEVLEFIPRSFGMIETDMGPGIVTNLVVDDEGKISVTLLQYLWEKGLDEPIQKSLNHFYQRWQALVIPSRDLLLHNIVVEQKHDGECHLMVIDGLGWSDMIPLAKISRRLAYKKAGRKIRNMQDRVKSLLQDKAGGGSWGIHGMIDPEKRNIP